MPQGWPSLATWSMKMAGAPLGKRPDQVHGLAEPVAPVLRHDLHQDLTDSHDLGHLHLYPGGRPRWRSRLGSGSGRSHSRGTAWLPWLPASVHRADYARHSPAERKGRAMSDSSNNFRLDGRKVVVTGGARGIGFAIARAAAGPAPSVALLDLEQEALDQAAAQLPRTRSRAPTVARPDVRRLFLRRCPRRPPGPRGRLGPGRRPGQQRRHLLERPGRRAWP